VTVSLQRVRTLSELAEILTQIRAVFK